MGCDGDQNVGGECGSFTGSDFRPPPSSRVSGHLSSSFGFFVVAVGVCSMFMFIVVLLRLSPPELYSVGVFCWYYVLLPELVPV